jgi:hypothetical protein
MVIVREDFWLSGVDQRTMEPGIAEMDWLGNISHESPSFTYLGSVYGQKR